MITRVKYHIPFSDYNGIKYDIRIYTHKVGVAQESFDMDSNALQIDEDNSENILNAMRGKTGTLGIVNNRGIDIVRSILPAEENDTPIRLYRLNDNGTEDMMWQGFLSSDTYNQDYISRPHELSLVVKSPLEAMKNMFAENDFFRGLVTFQWLIEYVIGRAGRVAGAILYHDYYIPYESANILSKKIDLGVMIDVEEIKYEKRGNITYETKSNNLNEILTKVCTFIGWVCREERDALYFIAPMAKNITYNHYHLDNNGVFVLAEQVTPAEINMADLEYMGTNHTQYISHGKSTVEVIAEHTTRESIELPDCPYGDLVAKIGDDFNYIDTSESVKSCVLRLLENRNDQSHSNLKFYYHHANFWRVDNNFGTEYIEALQDNAMMISAFPNMPLTNDHPEVYPGACLARMNFLYTGARSEGAYGENMKDGLYCVLWPYRSPNPTSGIEGLTKIFSMTSTRWYTLTNGCLKINANMLFGAAHIAGFATRKWYTPETHPSKSSSSYTRISVYLRIGNWYWQRIGTNDTAGMWVHNPAAISLNFYGSGDHFPTNWNDTLGVPFSDGLFIPIDRKLEGEIEFGIFAESSNLSPKEKEVNENNVYTLFIQDLKVEHLAPYDYYNPKDGENKYRRKTICAFDETESISVPFASYNGNIERTNIIFNENEYGNVSPAETINFVGPEQRPLLTAERPEIHLLGQMEEYYGKPRARIDLEVKPLETPLPLVRITGYDGKTYLPLSESRDWRTDTSTITCFEVPE